MARKTKKNHIIDENKRKQFNQENVDLMNEFLDYLRAKKRSELTIEGYLNDIGWYGFGI